MSKSSLINASSHFALSTALRLASATELAYAQPHIVERTVIDQWRSSRFCFLDVEATQWLSRKPREAILAAGMISCFSSKLP